MTRTLRNRVLAALKAVGVWTPHDVFTFARKDGGNREIYGALAYWVKRGKVEHHPKTASSAERWVFTDFRPADTQVR